MKCKCGRMAQLIKRKTPEGMKSAYFRIECGCGKKTPWCCDDSPTLRDYLNDCWKRIQEEE